jgi:hypothetical protein
MEDYEVDQPEIICNQARCSKCNTLVISHSTHDFKSCTCKNLSVDGGRAYLKRSWSRMWDYEEESIYSDAPFEIIRQHLYNASRGIDGKQPLTYIKLCDIDDQYLDNIIAYQEENNYTNSIDYKLQLLERAYRNDN